ncbi:cbb3-type cytochrome c oxidase subunit I [Gymnodinialimonas sp. 57CJ19]|uniref:cbb3-type cytochrome c oxidase subunit I n=1 Tax=Gymnodinialimonas sp. 57CJ19 TaxID=3138498 RepID=UPI003134439F
MSRITWRQQGPDRAYHDTYYVIAHGPFMFAAVSLVVLAVTLHFALLRRSTPRIAAFGAIALCVLALGIALMLAPQMFLATGGLPQRYIDYPDTFARWQLLATLGGSLGVAAYVTLFGLSLRAWLHRRRKR